MIDPPEVVSSSPAFQPKRGRKKMEGQTEMLLAVEGDETAPKRKTNRSIRAVEIEVTRASPHRKAK
jgi:hypothetical protein